MHGHSSLLDSVKIVHNSSKLLHSGSNRLAERIRSATRRTVAQGQGGPCSIITRSFGQHGAEHNGESGFLASGNAKLLQKRIRRGRSQRRIQTEKARGRANFSCLRRALGLVQPSDRLQGTRPLSSRNLSPSGINPALLPTPVQTSAQTLGQDRAGRGHFGSTTLLTASAHTTSIHVKRSSRLPQPYVDHVRACQLSSDQSKNAILCNSDKRTGNLDR